MSWLEECGLLLPQRTLSKAGKQDPANSVEADNYLVWCVVLHCVVLLVLQDGLLACAVFFWRSTLEVEQSPLVGGP